MQNELRLAGAAVWVDLRPSVGLDVLACHRKLWTIFVCGRISGDAWLISFRKSFKGHGDVLNYFSAVLIDVDDWCESFCGWIFWLYTVNEQSDECSSWDELSYILLMLTDETACKHMIWAITGNHPISCTNPCSPWSTLTRILTRQYSLSKVFNTFVVAVL